VLHAEEPEVAGEQGDTLGAQLRRRRRELGIRQSDAASLMGADPKSVML
jgi:DNA-binding XRE family transcriptional regulator